MRHEKATISAKARELNELFLAHDDCLPLALLFQNCRGEEASQEVALLVEELFLKGWVKSFCHRGRCLRVWR